MNDRIANAINGAEPFTSEPWPVPDLSVLNEGRRPPPSLPLEVFGPWARWVADTAEGTGPTPPDYAACALLAVGAALVGNARWVSPWPSWKEPPALWIGLIGSPSSGKSPALSPLLGIVRRLESELSFDFDPIYRRWQADREAAVCIRATWEADVKKAVKIGTPAPDMPAGAVEPDEPARPRLAVSDTTGEALAAILAGQPKGLLMFRDELAGWLAGFDRYSSGGSERALWLECNGGRAFTVDRVKNGGKPIRIPHLTMSVMGGIQPDRLSSLLFTGDDDGLASRLLMTWPEPIPPTRPRYLADDAAAFDALRRLVALGMAYGEEGLLCPVLVPLADDAAALFDQWRRENFAATDTATGRLAGHMGKLPGVVLRLALVLEYLWWAWGSDPIPPEVVTFRAVAGAAALVTDYFIPMAERAYGDAALPEADRMAATLARWIMRERPARINTRDLIRSVRLPGLRTGEKVGAAIAALVEADWLQPNPTRDSERKGRQRSDFIVSPVIAGGAI